MYMFIGIVTTVLMSGAAMDAMYYQQFGLAGAVLGIGTYLVFTLGRLHGLKEIK